MKFHHVYILESKSDKEHYYVGYTQDLRTRLDLHNVGKILSTRNEGPWMIKNAISFIDKEKATLFEKYLKTHSGRAWAKKHL